MLGELGELDFEHVHQGIDFVFGALEVFNTEGINRYDADSSFVTDFQDLVRLGRLRQLRLLEGFGEGIGIALTERETHSNQCFKSNAVPFNSLYAVMPCESPVPVHDKGDMFGNWSLA